MLLKKILYITLIMTSILLLGACGDRAGVIDQNVPTENDQDNDGLTDDDEINIYHTNPNNLDTDGDGLSDNEEINNINDVNTLKEPSGTSDSLDPCDPDIEADTCDKDNDGLTNTDEINIYHTNPNNPDTDGDGIKDGEDKNDTESTALRPCLPMQGSDYSDYDNNNSIWVEANCDDDNYSNGAEDNVSRNPSYISNPYDAGDSCFVFSNAKYCEVIADDNRTWMDRNLGAYTACGSTSEDGCYGDLYQWGRFTDGHEKRVNNTQDENPTVWPYTSMSHEVADVGEFDWLNQTSAGITPAYVSQRQDFWEDNISGLCPMGWRVPTIDELDTMSNAERITNKNDALNSNLHIPDAGSRSSGGSIEQTAVSGYLWSSTVNGNDSAAFAYRDTNAAQANANRSTGYSVRCIKASQ